MVTLGALGWAGMGPTRFTSWQMYIAGRSRLEKPRRSQLLHAVSPDGLLVRIELGD